MLDRIIRFSLTHRLLVLASALLLLVYGVWVIVSLPVDVLPDLNRPTVTVMTEAQGMAPEEVETLVTLPIETSLAGLPGVERVRTTSGIGLSIAYAEFGWGTDLFRNRQLVAEKLAQASEKLPRGLTPVMGPIASIMGEIQLLGLYSPEGKSSPIEIRTWADWTLRPRLLAIPGVAQVIAIGGGVRQYQILVSAEKLNRFQIPLEELEKGLAGLGRNTTGGFVDLGEQEFLIRNLATVRNVEDIRQSVVGLHFGKPVLVSDVAEVREGAQLKRGDGGVNGRPAVIVSIQKQPGANTIELTGRIDRALDALAGSLPPGVTLERELFKQSRFIETAVHNVVDALRDGTILVVIVLFVFLLNFRTTAITLTAIPLSFVLSAVAFRWMGLSVNTMTLGGLAVAIGELVDDAIVDVENVHRRLRENRLLASPRPVLQVVYEASSEVRNSIVYATIIVVLVFVPLFYLGGIEGRLFVPLGIAYIVSLLASLVVSLTVTPALCSILLGRDGGPASPRVEREGRLVIFLKRWDRRVLERLLDHPGKVIAGAALLLAFALALLPTFGRDFLPKFNEGTATVNLIATPGISLEASNRMGAEAERLLLSIPEIKSVARRTGRAEQDEHAEGVHYSEIDVDFKPEGRARAVVLDEIRAKLSRIAGAFVAVGQPISHRLDHLLSGVRAQIAIKIFGPDLGTLRAKAADVQRAIQGTPGLVDLQIEPQVLVPQVKIQVMREEAARFGINAGVLGDLLERALKGDVVAQVLEDQRIFNVFLRFDDRSRSDLELMKKTVIKVMPDGSRVRLEQVADVFESSGPNAVLRENSQRRIVVSANASGRDLESLVAEIKARVAAKVELPQGTFIEYGGQAENQIEAGKTLFMLGAISVAAIFVVLYAHFGSSFIALQVMLGVPMALIGSVTAIWISDRTLSVASLVAFITLCGIASRNGIMMISHYLHLMKHEGESFTRDMVIRGSLERLVPVLMTALTAILGLLPLVLSAGQPGKEILHPVAVVIVGGLVSSTLLDVIVTPAVFFRFGRSSAERATRDPANPSQGVHS